MIHLHESAESTNQLALDKTGAAHGETWLADHQTAGRGRREVDGSRRDWYSPPGHNVYMSVMLRPHASAAAVSGVTLAVGAHICTALWEQTGLEELWLKWPNDIWVGARKLAGVLTEARTGVAGVEAVVVGIGINVNLGVEDVPEDLEDIMTSVRIESGRPIDRLNIAFAVRHAILAGAAEYFGGGWDAVRDDVVRWDRSDGHPVEVELDGRWQRGTARGIEHDGGLAIEIGGERVVVTSGDVRFRG